MGEEEGGGAVDESGGGGGGGGGEGEGVSCLAFEQALGGWVVGPLGVIGEVAAAEAGGLWGGLVGGWVSWVRLGWVGWVDESCFGFLGGGGRGVTGGGEGVYSPCPGSSRRGSGGRRGR